MSGERGILGGESSEPRNIRDILVAGLAQNTEAVKNLRATVHQQSEAMTTATAATQGALREMAGKLGGTVAIDACAANRAKCVQEIRAELTQAVSEGMVEVEATVTEAVRKGMNGSNVLTREKGKISFLPTDANGILKLVLGVAAVAALLYGFLEWYGERQVQRVQQQQAIEAIQEMVKEVRRATSPGAASTAQPGASLWPFRLSSGPALTATDTAATPAAAPVPVPGPVRVSRKPARAAGRQPTSASGSP